MKEMPYRKSGGVYSAQQPYETAHVAGQQDRGGYGYGKGGYAGGKGKYQGCQSGKGGYKLKEKEREKEKEKAKDTAHQGRARMEDASDVLGPHAGANTLGRCCTRLLTAMRTGWHGTRQTWHFILKMWFTS